MEDSNSSDSVELPLDTHQNMSPDSTGMDLNGHLQIDGEQSGEMDTSEKQPFLRITEQPQPRGFRFRYKCEGPSHGGLQGVLSERGRKTYPTIKIENYSGPAKVIVTLVTDDIVPSMHAHELVGKNCNNGICVTESKGGNNVIMFQNLGIMHVTKKKVAEVLEERIMESMKLDHLMRLGEVDVTQMLGDDKKRQAKEESKRKAKHMQLNVVRLCFQAYLQDTTGCYTRLLKSLVSETIFDSKSPGAAALKICRMDKYGGCCTGNDEVFLLCEKVQKDDISVLFCEHNDNGDRVWEAYGDFGPLDVHRQFAIVFKTPPYKNTCIDRAVNVNIMLQRKNDGEVSEPKAFTYYPQNLDKDDIVRKRRKVLPSFGDGYEGPDGGAGAMGYNPQFPFADRTLNNGIPNVSLDGGASFNPSARHFSTPYDLEYVTSDIADLAAYVNCETLDELEVDASPYPDDVDVGITSLGGARNPYHNAAQDMPKSDFFANKGEEPMVKPCLKDNVTWPNSSIQEEDWETLKKTHPEVIEEKMVKPVEEKEQDQGEIEDDREKQPETEKENIKDEQKESKPVKVSELDEEKKSSTQPKGDKETGAQTPGNAADKNIAIKIARRMVQAMQDFAATGDVKVLLLVQRHLSAVHDENGDIPLHLGIINNQQEAVHQILTIMATLPESRKKVNTYNYLRQTPLHLAVLTRQPNVINMLLHSGVDPMLVDRNGNTPGHLAVLHEDEKCLRALVKYLRPGVTKAKPFPELDVRNYDGLSTLHMAAQLGNLNIMKCLVYGKANVDLRDGKSGRTALHHTVEADDLSIAGYLLLEAHADVNAQTFDGNTALHVACGRSSEGMVALLMAGGANTEMENDENCSDYDSDSDEMIVDDGEFYKHKHGIKAAYLAADNDRIQSILSGEPYRYLDSNRAQEDGSGAKADGMSDVLESGIGSLSLQGDMLKIDYLCRLRLSKLLDPRLAGKDWQAVAEKLKMTYLISALYDVPSPTRLLLDNYEVMEGSVDAFRKCLLEIGREDAVYVLDEGMKSSAHSENHASPTGSYIKTSASAIKGHDYCNMDSGVDSMK